MRSILEFLHAFHLFIINNLQKWDFSSHFALKGGLFPNGHSIMGFLIRSFLGMVFSHNVYFFQGASRRSAYQSGLF